MKNSLWIGLAVAALLGLLGSVYVVREDQTAMVLNLGKVVRADIKPGLHFKVPLVETVRLFDNGNVEDSIHRSKAVGEPPLLLPFSVFFAIRDAISAVADHKMHPPLNAPATSEEILKAVTACTTG